MRITTQKIYEDRHNQVIDHMSKCVPVGTLFIDAWDEKVLIVEEPAVSFKITRGGSVTEVNTVWGVVHGSDGKAWSCVVTHRIRQKNASQMDLIDMLLGTHEPEHLVPHTRQLIYLDELPKNYRKKPIISVPELNSSSI